MANRFDSSELAMRLIAPLRTLLGDVERLLNVELDGDRLPKVAPMEAHPIRDSGAPVQRSPSGGSEPPRTHPTGSQPPEAHPVARITAPGVAHSAEDASQPVRRARLTPTLETQRAASALAPTSGEATVQKSTVTRVSSRLAKLRTQMDRSAPTSDSTLESFSSFVKGVERRALGGMEAGREEEAPAPDPVPEGVNGAQGSGVGASSSVPVARFAEGAYPIVRRSVSLTPAEPADPISGSEGILDRAQTGSVSSPRADSRERDVPHQGEQVAPGPASQQRQSEIPLGVPLRPRTPRHAGHERVAPTSPAPVVSSAVTRPIAASRLSRAVEHSLERAYNLSLDQLEDRNAVHPVPSAVRNVFNVNVSMPGGDRQGDLDLLELEEALTRLLEASARRHGLEV